MNWIDVTLPSNEKEEEEITSINFTEASPYKRI